MIVRLSCPVCKREVTDVDRILDSGPEEHYAGKSITADVIVGWVLNPCGHLATMLSWNQGNWEATV